MAKSYDTDNVMRVFRILDNEHRFPVVITEYEDNEGPYVIINFTEADYMTRYNGDTTVFQTIAQYLIDLREAIESTGARVTFNVYEEDDDETLG